MSTTRLHRVDGKMRTTNEVAAMLGISRAALYSHMHRQRPASLQLIADMIRAGELGRGKRPAGRHRVHGQWMTVAQAANMTGMSANAIQAWRHTHRRPDDSPALLEAAVDHYMAVKAGNIPRYPPRPCRTYWVRGKQRTIAEAAALIGVAEQSIRRYTSVHKCSVDTAVKRLEAFYKARAAREILKILTEE